MDFVEGWAITQTLGEGTYGEVKLVVNKVTGEGVAMKVINNNPETDQAAIKEINIHKSMKHPNIISYYGARTHGHVEYIFLEYAPHGELFDRIEPDVGTPASETRKYFGQLLDAVEYIHSKGIAHRDIKPENILLDENYNVKLTDFGLATQFRKGNQERVLDKKCGTTPYVAPEVWLRPYAAEPADIWSCGIVLVALLCGELPWDKADVSYCDYLAWIKGDYANLSPWCKLDTQPLSLLKRILVPKPSGRYTISQIRAHRWLQSSDCQNVKFDALVSLSQGTVSTKLTEELSSNISLFLSQPTSLENMLVSTQSYTQSGTALTALQQMVKRITRFVSKLGLSATLEYLKQVMDKLKLNYNLSDSVMTVTTVDKRGNQLIFKATGFKIPEGTLLDFRLSKGCGLEFKKYYVSIRKAMQDIIIITPLFSN